MSQEAERKQGKNIYEGKSASGKDRFLDQALEAQSCNHSSSISELEEVNEVNENQQKIIAKLKEKLNEVNKVNENQQKIIAKLKEKVNEVNKVNENQQKIIAKLKEKVNEVNKVNENQQKIIAKLKEKVNELNEVKKNDQKRIAKLKVKLKEAERNISKDLWLYGLQEEEGENLKERVIAICSAVAPVAAGDFPLHIDIVQRVGKKSKGKNRSVIMRFTEKSTKELLLTTSNSSEFHRSSHLKFAEVLTAQDIEMRNRLWPQVEAARKEGKNAFFVGVKATINGKEIREYSDDY